MNQPAIVPIVEGQSECESVPILLRRLLARQGAQHVAIARPVRVKRYQVVRPSQLERAIALARRTRANCAAILIVLDADDDDPDRLRCDLEARADRATDLPVSVVLAVREFEAWLLGAKESLQGRRGIAPGATAPANPEAVRGAKEALSRNMRHCRYLEVDDQPALTAQFDVEAAAARCPSFRHLVSDVERLVSRLRRPDGSA